MPRSASTSYAQRSSLDSQKSTKNGLWLKIATGHVGISRGHVFSVKFSGFVHATVIITVYLNSIADVAIFGRVAELGHDLGLEPGLTLCSCYLGRTGVNNVAFAVLEIDALSFTCL